MISRRRRCSKAKTDKTVSNEISPFKPTSISLVCVRKSCVISDYLYYYWRYTKTCFDIWKNLLRLRKKKKMRKKR